MAYILKLLVWVCVPWWTQPLQVWDLWQQQDVGLLSAAQTPLLEAVGPVWLTRPAVHPDFCLYTRYHSCSLWHTQIILKIPIRYNLWATWGWRDNLLKNEKLIRIYYARCSKPIWLSFFSCGFFFFWDNLMNIWLGEFDCSILIKA